MSHEFPVTADNSSITQTLAFDPGSASRSTRRRCPATPPKWSTRSEPRWRRSVEHLDLAWRELGLGGVIASFGLVLDIIGFVLT